MTIKHIATKSITRMHQGASLLFWRMATVLLTAAVGLLAAPSASAQTVYTSDEINKAILHPGSIFPEWIQDETNPWKIMGADMNCLGPTNSSLSYITFTFTSDYPVFIYCYCPNGSVNLRISNTTLRALKGGDCFYKLSAGKHILNLYGSQTSSDSQFIQNFGIFELKDNLDATKVMTSKSLPFELENDEINPWFIKYNGDIQSSKIGPEYGSSEIKVCFECENNSVLSWDYCNYWESNYKTESHDINGVKVTGPKYFNFKVYDNGVFINSYDTGARGTKYSYSVSFKPGKHIVRIVSDQWWDNNAGYTGDSNKGTNVSLISSLQLIDDWISVETEEGDLGNAVIDEISKYGYGYLTDVELLKVKGQLNSNDWSRISQMTNLKGLDLKETNVKEIPSKFFEYNKKMAYIVLPDGLQTISYDAFHESSIRYITIPPTVTYIGIEAFLDSNLAELTLNEGLTRIGSAAFRGCKIAELTIPSTLETIYDHAFADNSRLTTLNFAEDSKLNTLDYCAFYGCSKLKSVTLPNSLTNFPTVKSANVNYYSSGSTYAINAAFSGCTSLEYIKFPDSLTFIPRSICYGCSNLKTAILPKKLKTIEPWAFRNAGITNIEFPETLKEVNMDAFWKSTVSEEIYEIKFNENLETIGSCAFYGNNIENVELPLHLTSLGEGAFKNCTNLKSVKLHSNAKTLPNFLTDCPKLETIILPCATPPTRSASDILGTQDKKAISLIVPDFALSSYRLDDYWYLFGSINSGDEADNQDYWNVSSELTLREGKRMKGKPDVNISTGGGSMRILGTTPGEFGELTIGVDATNPASILNKCPNIKADKMTNRFGVSANTWYFFTPLFDTPLADVKFTSECNSVFRYYDGEGRAANGKSGNWKNVAADGTLKAGQGYIFQCDVATTVIFPGDASAAEHVLNTEQRDVELTSHDSENAAHADWNFIGNPYPSYFDIWYLDVDAPITVYTGGKYVAKSITDDNYVLRPMEAFFVQKPTADAKALFTLDGRQVNANIRETRAAMPSRLHASAAGRRVFNLELSDAEGNALDQTRVVINERASEDYERSRDAAKFAAMTADEAQLYTIDAAGNRLAINERPLANGEVALGIATGATGEMVLSATRADGKVSLLDTKTGLTADLTEAPATIFAEAGQTLDGRYRLLFKPAETTAAEEAEAAGVRVIAGAGEITVSNPAGAEVLVCAADGTVIRASADKELHVAARPGVHIVRVGEAAFKVVVM